MGTTANNYVRAVMLFSINVQMHAMGSSVNRHWMGRQGSLLQCLPQVYYIGMFSGSLRKKEDQFDPSCRLCCSRSQRLRQAFWGRRERVLTHVWNSFVSCVSASLSTRRQRDGGSGSQPLWALPSPSRERPPLRTARLE